MKNTRTYKTVLKEVSTAYCDCGDMPFNVAMNKRNLNFKASKAVSVSDAIEIFKAAHVLGYNEFKPALLKKLPENAKVTIAREGSVCNYVKIPKNTPVLKNLPKKMLADEFDEQKNNVWRIWWD
jgi:hypothetical protein